MQMTQEIQNRIEQIRWGEVPEGYKKTKTGIVPTEWKEQRLSHYLTVNNDKNADLKYTKDDVFSISGELGIVNQIELLRRSYAGASVALQKPHALLENPAVVCDVILAPKFEHAVVIVSASSKEESGILKNCC